MLKNEPAACCSLLAACCRRIARYRPGLRTAVIALMAVMVVASYLSGFAETAGLASGPLIWEREAIAGGQWWRLLSGHAIHLNERHLLMNLLGLFFVTELLCERTTVPQFMSLIIVSALGVGLLLWLLQPQLQWYAGFSGVLHGLWSGSAGLNWIRDRTRIDLIALLALTVKLAGFNMVIADIPVVPEAHLYGALSGLLWLTLWRVCDGSVSGAPFSIKMREVKERCDRNSSCQAWLIIMQLRSRYFFSKKRRA